MVVYLCANLNHTHVGTGTECSDVTDRGAISLCRTELIIAAWAVGGQVSVYKFSPKASIQSFLCLLTGM